MRWVPSPEAVVGLDVGTTKVCTLIARPLPDRWDVIGFSSVPSRGLKRGIVVDLTDAATSIAESVERAEQMAGVTVRKAWVGITGKHIHSHTVEEELSLPPDEPVVTYEHLNKLMKQLQQQVDFSGERMLLHLIPNQFILDGVGGIRRPVGMTAREVKVRAHLITATSSFVRNLETCVEQSGIEVAGTVLEPFVAGEAILSETERQLGCAIIDIGGGTSDIAVFYDGVLVYSSSISIGGAYVTRDLAIGLRTTLEEAERLKILHGYALVEQATDELIEVTELGKGSTRPIPRKLLTEIIEPRMKEIFELAMKRLNNEGWLPLLVGGIVLVGGGALLEGTVDLAKQTFNLPVRIGEPNVPAGSPQDLRSPIYATVTGLVLYGLKHHQQAKLEKPPWQNWTSKLWKKIKSWLKI